MTILVTGAAGFIGAALSQYLLDRGEDVVGVDNLNDYYDVQLKKDRLAQLDVFIESGLLSFQKIDIANYKNYFFIQQKKKKPKIYSSF